MASAAGASPSLRAVYEADAAALRKLAAALGGYIEIWDKPWDDPATQFWPAARRLAALLTEGE